jgi:ABC transport system ATP-binding/permease protein
MVQIALRDLQIAYGDHPLLDKANMTLVKGERVCVIGRNGAGKSTLLKLIQGVITPDAGDIERAQGLVISTLGQEVPQGFTGTLYDIVAKGLGDVGVLLSQYEQLQVSLGDLPSEEMLSKLADLQHKIDHCHGWTLSQRIEKTLSQLSLSPHVDASTLSGGMRRRVLLAQALVNDPDVLILDEPTNHLDLEAILWLEKFLLNYRKTILFVSHDRAFMQNVATRFVEVDQGQLLSWKGDYQDYLKNKAASLEAEKTEHAHFDKKLAEEERWIRQGIKARRTRNEGRVRELEGMREERAARRKRPDKANITLQKSDESAKRVFEAAHVNMQFGDDMIIKDFNTVIVRGDKVGLIGPNGSGKTTLLKILLGEQKPTSGKIRQGMNLTVAYFDQYRHQLDESATVQENICDGSDMIRVNNKEMHVISYLQKFLFEPKRARTPVKALSGGERNRLLLAKLFSKPANVLIMDEPTNDLDVDTLELLEEQLLDFKGTLLLVSHDRAFLNNVVTSTLVLEGEGKVGEYIGGYDDWQAYLKRNAPSKKPLEVKKVADNAPKQKKSNLSQEDRKLLRTLPLKLEKFEAELAGLHKAMAEPDYYDKTDEASLLKMQQKISTLERAIEDNYTLWQNLEAH